VSWIICDGPVDAIWIENLNTVLDDNKILTLANAERIPMTDNCKMVFEVENLNNASPATVSRCGIVFISEEDLNWEPLITTFSIDRQPDRLYCNPKESEWLQECVDKWLIKGDMFKTLVKNFTYIMQTPPVVRITQFLNLLTAILWQFYENQEQIDKAAFERFFVYCIVWSIGGLFESEEREKFHKLLESKQMPLPSISA